MGDTEIYKYAYIYASSTYLYRIETFTWKPEPHNSSEYELISYQNIAARTTTCILLLILSYK